MLNISIVPMTEKHLDRVLEIENLCFSSPWNKASFVSGMNTNFQKYYSAIYDGNIVGYIVIMHLFEAGEILNIATTPHMQKNGIAQKLMDYSLDYMKKNGVSRVTLEVRASNVPARHLYQKTGFSEFSIRKNYYSSPFEDGIMMEKNI